MSWDSYIDNLIGYSADASGDVNCDKVCIISIDGGAKWTTDGHGKALKLSPQEAVAIASCFKAKKFDSFQEKGVHVEGKKYQYLRGEDGRLALAKVKGGGSLTLQSSKTAVVIAHCPEGKQQGSCNKAVASITEYLESQNF